jgi:hypothetical protein
MSETPKIGGSRVHLGDQYEVDPARFPAMAALLTRVKSNIGAGKHVWSVSLIHAVEDPEVAMDDMVMGLDNLLGIDGINCLICEAVYVDQAHPGPVCPGDSRA